MLFKVRTHDPGHIRLWCYGCEDFHYVNVAHPGLPRWTWNRSFDLPTLGESVRIIGGPTFNPSKACCYRHGGSRECQCKICHFFVTAGEITYLGETTHRFSGKTLDMAELRRDAA